MTSHHFMRSDAMVVGWSCRLPGANNIDEFWSLLQDGRCSVSSIPSDRWSLERYGHPGRQQPGKSYTWAAGVLDDAWGFDPSVFGISPREAEQMDPQQRLLLELTWEALEDAGMPPASLAGSEVGVFVGGSSTDFANLRTADAAGGDLHFATGNALSILANRISYAFDFRGPSLTIDTACSSSLVALCHAIDALQNRRIDVAVVGGINVLASPFSFISFCQASMLSPTGRSRAFSADADGYVRSEGGAVLVLSRHSKFEPGPSHGHGLIVAADTNSDGRTAGISLPSSSAQEKLLERIYARNAIDREQLAFVEAHGTGTPAGDPIEAGAIGRALGRQRNAPLPIGSVKSNIGHLEPAAGLAGIIKALLALKHRLLPRSLLCEELNPNIPFDELNLTIAREPLSLDKGATAPYAGVNSFGFGGTNAHAVVAAMPSRPIEPSEETVQAGPLIVSANGSAALAELAKDYANAIREKSEGEISAITRAAYHQRQRLDHRLVVLPASGREMADALESFAAGARHPLATSGNAVENGLPIGFIYSGNGSQWVGMGRDVYESNDDFRAMFEKVDAVFGEIVDWSLKECLFSPDLSDRLVLTSVAQPLIFAIQVATTAALTNRGIRPVAVLGHSVGEIAAAYASGALDLATAVKVIHYRSLHQELVAGTGDMAVLLAASEKVEDLARGVSDLTIAALNSPTAVTVAGTKAALTTLRERAAEAGVKYVDLNLGYPFHSALMDPVETPLVRDLDRLPLQPQTVPLVSTITGEEISSAELDSSYWWRNVREPVDFASAVRCAAQLGAKYFIEIGPKGTLQRHINDCLAELDGTFSVCSVLGQQAHDDIISKQVSDPINNAFAMALTGGADVDCTGQIGEAPRERINLPTYRWQHRQFRFTPTTEGLGFNFADWHPLCGERTFEDGLEWRSTIDASKMPELADHEVGGQVILPGAGFLEMAVAVARQWLDTTHVVISDLEILKPMGLAEGELREVLTRISPGSATIEILSRPRLTAVDWILHARAKMFTGERFQDALPAEHSSPVEQIDGEEIYQLAKQSGLNYGPAFRLVDTAKKIAPSEDLVARGYSRKIDVNLQAGTPSSSFALDPMRVDACFHGLFALFPELATSDRGVAYIPVRIDETSVYDPIDPPCRATILVRTAGPRSIVADFLIFDEKDRVIARFVGARFVAISVRRHATIEQYGLVEKLRLSDVLPSHEQNSGTVSPEQVLRSARRLPSQENDENEDALYLDGWATAAAYEIAMALADDGIVDLSELIDSQRLVGELSPWLTNLLRSLANSGLAKAEQGRWRIVPDPLLPSCSDVLVALATDIPSRAPEILLAGELTMIVKEIATKRVITAAIPNKLSRSSRVFHDRASRDVAAAVKLTSHIVEECGLLKSDIAAPHVLLLGSDRFVEIVRAHPNAPNLKISVLDAITTTADQESLVGGSHNARVQELLSGLPERTFDLVLSVGGLGQFTQPEQLAQISRSMRPNGALIGVETQPSLFRELVLGLSLREGVARNDYVAATRHAAKQFVALLNESYFEDAAAETLSIDGTQVIALSATPEHTALLNAATEHKPDPASDKNNPNSVIVELAERPGPLTAALATQSGARVLSLNDFVSTVGDIPTDIFVVQSETAAIQDSAKSLANRCLKLTQLVDRIGNHRAQLWIVHSGALASSTQRKINPVETGTWAFGRTLANEHPHLAVHRIDIGSAAADAAAKMLLTSQRNGTSETELLIENDCVRAMRVETVPRIVRNADGNKAQAARLERSNSADKRLLWQRCDRVAPSTDEVEIEVEATGLNFRDLMWSMEMLPDDMLEDGFTGPALGLECAGTIVRIGDGVASLSVGQRVFALAPSAFSTHVVVNAQMAAAVPDDMTTAAAATIPVAFMTAYYGLVTLARLEPGESVLIHGAAGAVGLAAIQVAQQREAKILATAGSPAKRDLLRALGVPYVLDSRSTAFVDDVRAITGDGVDVVLNSLAKSPMERSVQCLRPFGRFVELGKRDYVENTHLGLRPFRRNLTYFGVDVDQLIHNRRTTGRQVFGEVIRLIDSGDLTPLPHCVFEADRVSDGFQLMLQSAHIGKIVVTPPDPVTATAVPDRFIADPSGCHLVTGAFSGFGLETVRWLVDRGARFLALVGRTGAASDEARREMARLKQLGVKVHIEACDVSDARATAAMIQRIRTEMPPLVGVVHAAMVLEDGLIANLDSGQLERVLAPKVKGADNLDKLTREADLDYFVMYSSVTTLIGNPGQASYVAANAYMEGVARRRRREGLPALAIGWGPIADVGVIARNKSLEKGLIERRGLTGMKAAEALALLGDILVRARHDSSLAVITIAPQNWAQRIGRMPVLSSPTYSTIVGEDGGLDSLSGTINLRELIASEKPEIVKRKVISLITSRLASVLRARESDLDPAQPLSHMGLDSLMSFELAASLEDAFEMPVPVSSGLLTISGLADQMIAQINQDPDTSRSDVASTVAARHFAEARPADLVALKTLAGTEVLTK